METSELLSLNFSLKKYQRNLPKNIYAIRVLNVDKNETFCLAIEHDGYCPHLNTDRDESNFGEYLCNLQSKLIGTYYKANKTKKPKQYYSICEVMTNENGELYRYSKSVRQNEIICGN